ncbi:MAG: HAD family phosphatase [Ruminococcus sp.]|nr:HAD family phosphatase [Ruminococcus sp.]
MGRFDFDSAIFDLDGTLVRSSQVWSDIDRDFLGKRGFEVPKDYCKAVSVLDFPRAAVYTKERFALNETVDQIMQEWHDMAIDEYTNVIEAVEGADKFLHRLKEKGVKIALATASSEELYAPVLKRNGLYSCFDTFVTTTEVSRGKGFPDIYELACRRLGGQPETSIVFEDIIEGIKGAKAGGFTAAACLNEKYSSDKELMIQQADLSFNDYNELMSLLE